MKLEHAPFLFIFALLLNYCQCRIPINVYAIVNGIRYEIDELHDKIYTFNTVFIQIETQDLSNTNVIVRVNYYGADSPSGDVIEIAHEGLPTPFSRKAYGTKARLTFTPEDPANYVMATKELTIDFLPYPIIKVILPEDQPAVARRLAISGKIVELTKN